MKVKILAAVILILVLLSSALNTHFLLRSIDKIENSVEALSFEASASESKSEAEALFESYKKAEGFLSLTVSHNDLTDIESFFSEMIGYLSVSDKDGAKMAKSRLIDALAHLRRLSGVNISSIF
jgi:predicted xylose isomerase-like sugar epimerase